MEELAIENFASYVAECYCESALTLQGAIFTIIQESNVPPNVDMAKVEQRVRTKIKLPAGGKMAMARAPEEFSPLFVFVWCPPELDAEKFAVLLGEAALTVFHRT